MSSALLPDFGVSNWEISETLYCDLLGFGCVYERPEEGFGLHQAMRGRADAGPDRTETYL